MRWWRLPLCPEMQCHFKRPHFKDAIRANCDINLKCKNVKVLQQHHVDMVLKNMLKQAIHAIRIYEYRLSFQFRNCHKWKFICSHANFLIHKGSRVKINMQINSSITHWLQAISKFSLVTETREIILALRGYQSYLFR